MSFETTVKHITTMQLHPMVDKVLWSIASRRILHDALPMDGNIQKAEIVLRTEEEKGLWVCSQTTTTWQSNPVYRRFAKHYNRLVDIQDELIHQLPYPLVDTNGGSLEGIGGPTDQDPVVQLTTNACKALANELDFIENLLYRARIFHQLKQE